MLARCGKSGSRPVRITAESVYPNDYFVPGAGYYHAPFHAFFARPYNDYNPATGHYYYGGEWGAGPYESVINVSSPTSWAAATAESMRSDVSRGGFGQSSHGYGVWS